MTFTFIIRSRIDNSLTINLNGAGPDWEEPLLPKQERILRVRGEQLEEWLPYLDSYFEKGEISIELQAGSINRVKINRLIELQSPAILSCIENLSKEDKDNDPIRSHVGDNRLDKIKNWFLSKPRLAWPIAILFFLLLVLRLPVWEFFKEASNESPVAKITVFPEETVEVGTPVKLSGNSSKDPDGEVSNFEWSIAGDVVSNEAEYELSFPIAEAYLIKLCVTDNEGATHIDERVIKVTERITVENLTGFYDGEYISGRDTIYVTLDLAKINSNESSNLEYRYSESKNGVLIVNPIPLKGFYNSETKSLYLNNNSIMYKVFRDREERINIEVGVAKSFFVNLRRN